MADRSEFTETERKALAVLEARFDQSKPKVPISASFRDRMASATVDPEEQRAEDKPDGVEGLVIIRP